LDSTKERVWGTEVPVGSRGETQVGGLGTNPVGDMGNEVPREADDIFRLKGIFLRKMRQ